MDSTITRRDFIHNLGLASLGLTLPAVGQAAGSGGHSAAGGDYYPPVRTGMRGSHPGAFETTHAMVRDGKSFEQAEFLEEEYDLVVVGGGISGLAVAHYYREHFGSDSRILVLENHDDFGGHAKRNEFHQGGRMRLSWGGTMNLEYSAFSKDVHALLKELGVNIDKLVDNLEFSYGHSGGGGPAIWFDAATFGKDVLVPNFDFRFGGEKYETAIDKFPISRQAREALKQFYARRENVFDGKSESEVRKELENISYTDFLSTHGGVSEEVTDLFIKTTHGYWGVGADSLSAAECIDAGLPILHLLGHSDINAGGDDAGGDVAMFPDGNASIARLLVKSLIPEVAPECNADNVAMARFDYSHLDKPPNPVRIRLNSTAVNLANTGGGVVATYVSSGRTVKVKARHGVLACYHAVIPHLCPDMPAEQKQAQRYLVKRPLLLTNVLLRDSKAFDKLGISGAYCPGRLHGAVWQIKGVNTAEYRHEWVDDGTLPVMFWGSVAPPQKGLSVKQQHRASGALMLEMSFEHIEREVRSVLDGMLSPAGFNVQTDILAITVNRWPHGYSYDYLDLWDPDWPEGEAPHEIARRRFGNVAVANADAGADAYTHTAIDQARRAVADLA